MTATADPHLRLVRHCIDAANSLLDRIRECWQQGETAEALMIELEDMVIRLRQPASAARIQSDPELSRQLQKIIEKIQDVVQTGQNWLQSAAELQNSLALQEKVINIYGRASGIASR